VGYKREKLQILGGGFNLLPPGDKVPKADYLQAQNWRVDRQGRLVSRFGYVSKFSIASAGLAHSGFVNGGINGDYYVGCNDTINPTTSKLYWNFNASAIATGFDGYRIGLACMNGWVYFMNRGKQGRHQGSLGAGTSQTWNVAAPTNSPVPSTASNPTPSASVTYNYTIQGSTYVHFLNIAGTLYSFVENGYSAGQLPLVIASLASQDPNCTVSYSGSGSAVVITPIVPNTLVQVSGSDGNTATNLANGTVTSLPNGTYQFYVTYQSADATLESNPSPVSVPIALANQSVTLTSIPVSGDGRVGIRNIYAVGGTLGQPYQVTTIGDNTTTSLTFNWSDLAVTNAGNVMPTDHDPPPAASGMVGPHFSRLFAWSTATYPNRLFYTDPDLPQYWPGSADPAEGNWVDVGAEGEAIVWCTVHTNILVIYKERTIWMLVGDPGTGYLQQMTDATGLAGQFAVIAAGNKDYFVGPGGLHIFDIDRVLDGGAEVLPIFQAGATAGPSPNGSSFPGSPGSIKPGTAYNGNSLYPYALALGYGMGKLYVGYAETIGVGTSYCTLVYHEDSKRWFYHRNGMGGATGFFGFVFDGAQMVGLGGSAGGTASGYNIDGFGSAYTQDNGAIAIPFTYQSHYEDAGAPDNQKKWLDLVIDYEFAGDTATVSVGYDNGANLTAAAYSGVTTYAVSQWVTSGGLTYQSLQGNNIGHTPAGSPTWWMAVNNSGTITGTGRQAATFALGTDGVLAKNISVLIAGAANGLIVLHNVYLSYYEEARLAAAASTMPTDLGIGKVKQCKELELDIDASQGAVNVNLYSDLPGNALAVRQTPTVAANSGRAVMRYPFSTAGPPPSYTEGYLWRVALSAAAGPFRIYAVRLLMRAVGVYVEAYEAAAGFVWDSMEESFESLMTKVPRTFAIALAAAPIKRFRELSLEIDTFNAAVTYTFLTDLPGNAQASRQTGTVNTGTAGRRFFRIPLPGGSNTPIEGRLCRLQLSGSAKFILYGAAVELLPVGVYIEAYEGASTPGAVYDSRQQDGGTPNVKEARELELDIETTGAVTVTLSSDITTPAITAAPATTGRQKVMIPLTVNAAAEQFFDGRLYQLIISGSNAFRLYDARIKVRVYGHYLQASEGSTGALWDSTDLDLGTQTVKQLRELQLELSAAGAYTVVVYTDLPGNAMVARVTSNQSATTGRTAVQIPLPQGSVPDNYIFGRLVRVTIASNSDMKLFGARIHARPIGVYVESYEAAAGAVWDSTPSDLGSPADKIFEQLRFELDTDGAATVAVYTDLPGENFTGKGTYALTAGATGRHWATVPLPAVTEGRSIRLVVTSAAGFRIYRAQVRHFKVGRYLAMTQPAGNDSLTTLEFDFKSERVKAYKKLEIDMRADGAVSMAVLTNQSGQLATQYTPAAVTTPNGRATIYMPLTPGIRGRLLRLSMTNGPARIYHLRVWTIAENEPGAKWQWEDYPLEESDVLPAWADLPVEATPPAFTWSALPVPPTPPEWQWAPFPVNPTPPGSNATDPAQWQWGKFLQVEETAPDWKLIDVPFEVTE